MASMRVYQQGVISIGHFNVRQVDMLKLGTVGLGSVLRRVRLGRNAEDAASKPLVPSYARWKLKHGLIPRRDLWGAGVAIQSAAIKAKIAKGGPAGRRAYAKVKGLGDSHMLDNLRVTTVTESTATIGFTTRSNQLKALANKRREPFMLFSARNVADIDRAFEPIFGAAAKKMFIKGGSFMGKAA